MSKILEEYGEQVRREVDIEIATRMLVDGKLRLEEIVEYTGLEMAEVEELARKMSTRECEEEKCGTHQRWCGKEKQRKIKKTIPGMV